MTDDTESVTLTLDIPQDDAHAEMVRQLRDAGIDVETAIVPEVQPVVDKTIHDIFLASKYDNE